MGYPQIASDHTSAQLSAAAQADFFDTSHLKSDFKAHCIRGSAVTVAGQGARFVIQTASTVVLARLLTPSDYGMIAMVTAVTGFMMTFKDLGLSSATIQKAETNHAQISTLFWINVAVSLVITLITAALAPAIAWFYHEPRLTWIGLALSTSFLFVGLSVQHQALLRRQMRFTAVVTIDIASMLVGAVIGLAFALFGAGYWALAAMQVGTAVAGMTVLWLACKWRPGWPARGTGVRSMLRFGADITGFNVIHYFSRNADKILLGRFYGPSVTGLYSRAYGLFMLPITQMRGPLAAVAMPALSRLQNEPEAYARYYYRLIFVLSFITMPLMGFLFVCSESLIHLLLGPKWMDADRIFKILAVAGFIQATETTRGLTLISLGQSGRYFRLGIFGSIFSLLTFVAGIPWGAQGVALAYTIGDYVRMVPSLWYSFQGTPVSVTGFLRVISRPAMVALVTTAGMFLTVRYILESEPDVVVILGSLGIGIVFYLAIWAIIPGGRRELADLLGYVALLSWKGGGRGKPGQVAELHS